MTLRLFISYPSILFLLFFLTTFFLSDFHASLLLY